MFPTRLQRTAVLALAYRCCNNRFSLRLRFSLMLFFRGPFDVGSYT
jgi:hypothetical protein